MLCCLNALAQISQDTIIKRNKDTIYCYVTKITSGCIYYVNELESTDTLMVTKLMKSNTYGTVDNVIYCSAYKRKIKPLNHNQSKPSSSSSLNLPVASSKDTIIKSNKDTIFCYVTNVTSGFIYYVTKVESRDTIMLSKYVRKGSFDYEVVENVVYCSAYKRFHHEHEAKPQLAADSSSRSDSTVDTHPSNINSSKPKPVQTKSSTCSSVQCSGTTQAGHRCKRMTTNCSGRCYQH